MQTIVNQDFLNALLLLALIVFIIAIGVVLLNQHFQKNLYLQKIERETLKGLQQNDLLRSSIHIQEEERKGIAQDIHDELGAVLSIMRMHLIMLEEKTVDTEEKKILSAVVNARKLSETALASVRSISHRLMPPQLEQFGLIKTLDGVVQQMNETGTINIQLTVLPDMVKLSWLIDLGLYRIILELINNTIKHAGANNIVLLFSCDHKFVTCVYTDDGKGMPLHNEIKGLGLMSIEGRASALGGVVKFDHSTFESGFSASVIIPIENNVP